MTLHELRKRLVGVGCAAVVAGVLAGCGGSGTAAATATGGGSVGTGGGSSAPAPITGIATPKNVSVVTAN